MNTRSALCMFPLLALTGALGACSGMSAPVLTLTGARAVERTPDGVAVEFTLDARNDNDVPLPLRDVEYRVDVGGQAAFAGTRSAEATLRASGTQTIRLPAVINLARAGDLSGAVRYRVNGTLRYVTPGQIAEIMFDTGVRVPSVSFAGGGEIDLSAARELQSAPGATFVPLPNTAPDTPVQPTIAP